ncbi:MAG: hypothetical protein KDB79_15525, partial [Acidobacteria bacterium]|nr:hypothetical protein [Acidobacteriota bacterium]
MSLFKDLIDELKEENLLEETIDEHLARNVDDFGDLEDDHIFDQDDYPDPGHIENGENPEGGYRAVEAESFTSVELVDPEIETIRGDSFETAEEGFYQSREKTDPANDDTSNFGMAQLPEVYEDGFTGHSENEIEQISNHQTAFQYEKESEDTSAAKDNADLEDELAEIGSDPAGSGSGSNPGSDISNEVIDPSQYSRNLADTVKSLQHVQHIISGVQREQMREKPMTYDTVPVKQALHKFIEAVENLDKPGNTAEESVLHEEIGKWHSTLLEEDRKVSAAHLRRYCEDTAPPLSYEAIASMARFYRNSPFNEDVRSKFDLVITRLFTKSVNGDKREPTLHRDEIIIRVKELYADWSSVSLYNDDNEDSELILAAFKFEDFVTEVNKVPSFDELIRNGFFKRIKSFKEKLQENFFSPLLVAVAVECNVLIGNRYVDLIYDDRKKVSDRVSKKRSKKLEAKPADIIAEIEESVDNDMYASTGFAAFLFGGKRKWITFAGIAVLLLGFLYAFGAFDGRAVQKQETLISQDGENINLERSSFGKYIDSARIKKGTFVGVISTSWHDLSFKQKEEILKKIQLAGKDRGYEQVQLQDAKGESVGF